MRSQITMHQVRSSLAAPRGLLSAATAAMVTSLSSPTEAAAAVTCAHHRCISPQPARTTTPSSPSHLVRLVRYNAATPFTVLRQTSTRLRSTPSATSATLVPNLRWVSSSSGGSGSGDVSSEEGGGAGTSAVPTDAAAAAAAGEVIGDADGGAPPSTDPMSMSGSPRYTSHAEAERAAYRQEDGVEHRDFGVAVGCPHGGSSCGCEGGDGAVDDSAAAAEASRHPRRDFGSVFHQEVAAWRATQKDSHSKLEDVEAGHGADAAQLAGRHTGDESESARSSTHGAHQDGRAERFRVRPEDIPPGMTYESYLDHLEAEEEMQRFLAQNTMHSIRRSMARQDAAAEEGEAVLSTGGSSAMRARLAPHKGYRGVQALLDYNKQWAAEVSRFNPRYFVELAKEQKPEYLWIGCSDSRVPANEVIGLHPGDVFVHRNIGNIFSLSDLNCLSALQFAVDCLKVQHVIIAGHYKCGGVTAAMRGDNLGLTDHWIMQVADIKNKWWDRVMSDIAEEHHLSLLCELNVLEQLSHVVNCRIVQRRWKAQNANDRYYGRTTHDVYVRPEYATKHLSEKKIRNNLPSTVVNYQEELEVHGWVYSLDDGILRPLLSLTRHSNVKREIAEAIEALFIRYSQMI